MKSYLTRIGGPLRSEVLMDNFRNVLDLCSLYKLPFDGDPYRWIKGRRHIYTIKERLDWCFVNNHWQDTFAPIITQHLDYYKSDHRAISVEVSPLVGP